ncbi:MAG: hypothetical protein KatS3mg110_3809 [Pirellulaceae bacterium]|nr:MAG: hypothetical protein KatS3mg110_3809 [Pirellulaceae bacterium]
MSGASATSTAGSPSTSAPATSVPAQQGSAPAGTAPIKPPVISREQIENLQPPDGSPEVLLAYLEALERRMPRGRTQRELFDDIQRAIQARVTVAERLFDHPEATPEMRREAMDLVLASLQDLSNIGAPNVLASVRTFCNKLAQDRDSQIAATGRLMLFSLDVGDLVDGKTSDPQGVLQAARKLMAEEQKDGALFAHVRTAALSMIEVGHRQEGLQLVRELAETFAGTTDPALARQRDLMLEEARFLELDLPSKILAFAKNEPDSLQPLLDGTAQLLSIDQPGLGTLQQSAFIADALERNGQIPAAQKVYQLIKDAYKATADSELRKLVDETVQYAERRFALLAKPFVPAGKTFDGREFRWDNYQGKVVLITFWSAENIQYLAAELPELKRLHDVYKERGFAVVGINIDGNRRLVEQFFAFQPMPWETIMDGSDGQGKLMQQCGVRSVPFTFLVDSQGVVTDLHVNVKNLPEKLVKLLNAPGGQQAPKSQDQGAVLGGGVQHYVAFRTPVVDEPQGDPVGADNPYRAPDGLSREELVRFLEKMAEKPASIQARPGFAEAVIEAAERILADGSQDQAGRIAIEHLLRTWQRLAADGRAGADEQLEKLVARFAGDGRPAVSRLVEWLELELAAVRADQLPIEQVPELLGRIEKFFEKTQPGREHLRLASATVHAVNRLEVADRAAYFDRFGKVWSTSTDRQLAAYGRRVAAGPDGEASSIVGQRLELSGLTAAGTLFDWRRYEGKVVLVDFWATWCGPCVREMPKVKALYEKWKAKGFEVVGVNLDRSSESLAEFLEKNHISWPQLIGDDARQAAERYQARAIPWLLLVDRQGRIVHATHHVDDLQERVAALLERP